MKTSVSAISVFVSLLVPVAAIAADGAAVRDSWLAAGEQMVSQAAEAAPETPAEEPEAHKEGPPLPFHCIEGYSGGAITPMGYVCNMGPKGGTCGKPVISYSFLNIGSKELHVFAVTQVFFNRIEIGYAYNDLSLGSFRTDVKNAGLNPGTGNVQMHNFNIRALLLEENSFDLPLPGVAAGVHFKYNADVKDIDRRLGGALSGVGFDSDTGVDYTITASKMFPELAFGRPVIVSAGLRFTEAAQLGLLGFGDTYRVTFEGSVCCLPTDWLVLGYEFRQKSNPYHQIPGLLGDEDNWHAFSATAVINDHLTVSAVYGALGHVANASADCTLGVQVKWEF